MEIEEHIPLAPLTMFQIGGTARYFVSAKNDDDVARAIQFASKEMLPHFVLGGGSNVLISDGGFSGVVIHMKNDERIWSEDDTLVTSGAGVSWDALVEESVTRERFGLENLSGIPGSVGGAAGGNIGAYGSEVKETIAWVDVFDPESIEVRRLSNAACRFGYRDSIFKQPEGKKLIILRVAFRLAKTGVLDRDYKDVVEYEKNEGTIASLFDMRAAILAIRGKKFPLGKTIGTAGSFFKNPVVSGELAAVFLGRYPSAPNFPQRDGRVKLSAAWIIDRVLHMRGVREKYVGTWEAQALVLVNYGEASSDEVKLFAQMIIDRAQNETGITLTPEVIYVG